jgi:hypothetical protein
VVEEQKMGKYQVRVFVESALHAHRNVEFRLRQHRVQFLFGDRTEGLPGFEAESVFKADSWQAAVGEMNELIPELLDLISFRLHSPMLLGLPTRVLKAEPGATSRRAILFGRKTDRNKYYISGNDVNEINELLARDFKLSGPVLRWLRNTYRPLPIWDRFVFAWLALENLAGTKQVTKKCPHCRRTLPSFNSGDREASYEIVRTSQPARKSLLDGGTDCVTPSFTGGKNPSRDF